MVSLDEPEFDIVARTNPTGKLIVHGRMEISDGTSNTVVFAENRGSSASCSASDEGGLVLEELTISFRYQGSGERILATIVPDYEQTDEHGRVKVQFSWDRDELDDLDLWLVVDPEYHPGRGSVGSGESISVGGNRSETRSGN